MIKLAALTKNTFKETIRQPIYAIIILIAILLFVVSPALTMFSMDDDQKLLREIGLSTLFLTSLFIAIFSSSGVVAEEIRNKTALTVLSKPVSRITLVLAKFCGVSLAVLMAHFIGTVALLISVRHGVLESVNDTHDWTAIATAAIGFFASLSLAALFNYIYDWRFSSSFAILLAAFSALGIIFLTFIDRNLRFNPAENHIHITDISASVLLLFAALLIVAISVALSTRFNIVVTLTVCLMIFLIGLVTDYLFGRFAETNIYAKIAYFLLPNLQIFWVSDTIYEEQSVPPKYIAIAARYALCYTAAILALAVAMFQKREVGK